MWEELTAVDHGTLDYDGYVEIADGIYWVGFVDVNAGIHCNPYLIVDHDEAVLIDGGSRNDFGTVMLKIMRTGTNPRHITRLIYQHYDPDLCGNLPHMEAIIGDGLEIISHHENNVFIDYYSTNAPKLCIERLGYAFEFSSGRRLEFIRTPYAHSSGSFVTYDTKTRALFSSDIFGSFDTDWSLYSKITGPCAHCVPTTTCPQTEQKCQMHGVVAFHRRVMTSAKALRYALERIEALDVSLIAPQHGSILDTAESRSAVIAQLKSLTDVGIDGFLRKR